MKRCTRQRASLLSTAECNSSPITVDDDTAIPEPGVAGWNDRSATADAARDLLRRAAGISIPKAGFVMRMLALYLLVLVPLNWIFFRSLGRVEWAWVATPIIALGGMAAVVKLAQLDIGFARSQTELAVLELQGGYPRGHLTRYTALYTSLSTTYDANSADRTTVILPFPSDPNFVARPGQPIETVTYQGEPEVQLADFGVSSNSTSLLHSEQIINVGGPIELVSASGGGSTSESEGTAVSNRSNLDLKRAGVLRRTADGAVEVAWVGDLPPGRKTKLQFQPAIGDSFPAEWSYEMQPVGESGGKTLNLEPMAAMIRQPKTLAPGETRLLALVERPLAGLEIDPAASQTVRGGTLVVVNLQYPSLAANPPQPDTNTHRDVVSPEEERESKMEPLPDDVPDANL